MSLGGPGAPPADRRHRRALRRAARDLHVALRPLQGTGHPSLATLREIAAFLDRAQGDVAAAKRTAMAMAPIGHAAGVLSMINRTAIAEGLDPFLAFQDPDRFSQTLPSPILPV